MSLAPEVVQGQGQERVCECLEPLRKQKPPADGCLERVSRDLPSCTQLTLPGLELLRFCPGLFPGPGPSHMTVLSGTHGHKDLFLLFKNRSVMLDRAENLLHDHYGGKEYWDVSVASSVCVNACSLGNISLPPTPQHTHTHAHTQSSSCVHLLPSTVRPSIWGCTHW